MAYRNRGNHPSVFTQLQSAHSHLPITKAACGLRLNQLQVSPALLKQFLVAPRILDKAILYDMNHVASSDRTQTMSDSDGCSKAKAVSFIYRPNGGDAN
jgi:hypothetical protein